MTNKIFISYAAEDKVHLKEVEQLLLEQRIITGDNYSIVNPLKDSISSGKNIRKSLKKQIQSASTFVVLATDNSTSSQRVNYEAGMADALDKPIVVVRPKGFRMTRWKSNLSKFRTFSLKRKAKDYQPRAFGSHLSAGK